MEALARKLMGLSHAVQLVGRAREVDSSQWDWPDPPQLERTWFVVFEADDQPTLEWRTTAARRSFESIGMRCSLEGDGGESLPFKKIGTTYVEDADGYAATLVLRQWPREVPPGWLGQALSSDIPVDVGVHVEPEDPQRFARYLRKQASWQSQANEAKHDAANDLGQGDAERVRMKLIARTDRPCKVSVALTVRARTLIDLRKRVKTVQHELGLALADVREATFEHSRGLEATSLTGRCRIIGAERTLDCTSVASTWPFQPGTICHKNGADIGTSNGMLVKLDPFDDSLESFGGIVLAKVGMGKSYFLKLLARRLENVEVRIVEQRTPPEYGNIPGAQVFNLADYMEDTPDERAARLRAYVSDLWQVAQRDPRPRLLILDELWSLLRHPAVAALIEEIARIGRHHYLALWIATQQVKELLDSDGGLAVLNNAAIRILLKQHDLVLDQLSDKVGLSTPARRFLRSAARGQALIDVGGMVLAVDVQASPDEHKAITTDPRERRAA